MRFPGKVAIVTGGGSGIGEATCRLFAEEGAKVVVVDVVGERVHRAVGGIRERGGQALGVVADLRRPSDIERIGVATVDTYGGIDILVNNAGVVSFGGLLEVSEEEWERMLDINLRAVYRCSKMAVPVMMNRGRGKIVNVASTSAFLASPRVLAYATSKGAVVSLTRAMAIDPSFATTSSSMVLCRAASGQTSADRRRAGLLMKQRRTSPSATGASRRSRRAASCSSLPATPTIWWDNVSMSMGGQSVVNYPRTSPCFSEKGT